MKRRLPVYLIMVEIAAILLTTSCHQPSPFIGTWTDNKGDEIVFMADNTFMTKIGGMSSEGTYSVMLNVVSFTKSTGQVTVSEWDIRGNLLYITWTDSLGHTTNLTLYKVKN